MLLNVIVRPQLAGTFTLALRLAVSCMTIHLAELGASQLSGLIGGVVISLYKNSSILSSLLLGFLVRLHGRF